MSLNDPQWGNRGQNDDGGGKRPNQGPPDLEELWRDLNRRLSGAFDRKGGGKGGNQPPADFNPRFLSGGIGLLIAVVIAIWLISGFYIVDASERGVVLQFGEYKKTTEPGWQWRLPYPIQSHEIVALSKIRTIEVGYRGAEKNKELKEALMLTDDENIINIQFAVQYSLKDAYDFAFKNRFYDRDAEDFVRQVAETAIREIVGKNKMDFMLYEGREQITAEASNLMQEILDRYATGIIISRVTMQNAQPPEQVQAAFDDAVKAGQDRERQKNEGQAYANDVIPKAHGAAARLSQEAEGYRQRMVATAEGEASRFKQIYEEYAKAPEVTRTRLYLEAIEEVYASTSKVMVDTQGQGNLLYLPLDKLMQATGAGAAPQIQNRVETDPAAQGSAPLTPNMGSAAVERLERQRGGSLRSRSREGR